MRERMIDIDTRSHSAASCGVRYSDKLGVKSLARRSIPIPRKPNQGRTEQGVFGDVDRFALDEPRLERFGRHSAAGEPSDERILVSEQRSRRLDQLQLGQLNPRYLLAIARRWSTPGRIS